MTLTSGTSVGSTVSVGGTAIGTIAAGGTGTDNLIVTFNSNAMPAAVSTLIQALTYFDSSTNNPTPLQRTIAVTVNDGLTGTDTENVLSAPTSPRNTAPAESREFVDRLLSQVEALKSEVRELTEAQQQPAHAIAAIEAEQESRRAPPVYWYSDPAALSSEPASGPEPWGVVPLSRRPAGPRPTLR